MFVFYSGFAIIVMDLVVTGMGGGVGTEGPSLGGALHAGCFHTLVAVDSLARQRSPTPWFCAAHTSTGATVVSQPLGALPAAQLLLLLARLRGVKLLEERRGLL